MEADTGMSTPVPSNGPGAQWSPGMKLVAVFVAGALFGAFSSVEISKGSGGGGGGGGQVASDFSGGGGGAEGDGTDVAFGGGGEDFAEGGDFGADAGSSTDFGGSDSGGGSEFGSTGATSGDVGTSSGTTSSGGSAPASSGGGKPRQGSGVTVGGGTSGGGGTTGGGTGGGGTGSGSGCKGGKSDKGVSASAIKVASTVVLDGPGASLLSSSPVGMRAVINKTNRAGGVCGRRIELTTVNDSWDAARGQQILRRFMEEDYFALTVVPSSEGLGQAIDSGDVEKAGIPVVGTDGMRINQYKSAWVWPVATATVSTMRIIAQHAYSKGARKFGIVWDQKFRFGIEGATAYKDQVKKLGGSVVADMPLDPDKPSYGTEAQTFNRACGTGNGNCEAVALLLVPSTALTWRNANSGENAGRAGKAPKLTYGHQTLFTDDFASACRDWCDGMIVWTGYNPPIPPVDTKPGVAKFVADVRAERAGIDFRNQFLEGAYLGMSLFVDAVGGCSPELTRACLKNRLNSVEFKSDLSNSLKWTANARNANKTAQAFQIEASGGSFNGWRYLQTGWVKDPAL